MRWRPMMGLAASAWICTDKEVGYNDSVRLLTK